MNARKNRLNEVYEHLRNHFGIHTKTQFAAVLKITQPALSSAINGNEAYLTDNLFKRICAAYQGVFNLDYLLTGKGKLLMADDTPTEENHGNSVDYSSLVNAALAAKDETIAALKRTISSQDELIASLRAQLREKDGSQFRTALREEKIFTTK